MKSLWTSTLLISLATSLFSADALPRYNLPAGRQLSYSVDGSTTGPTAYTSHDSWTLTMLTENKDGSRSILADVTMVHDNTGEAYGPQKGKSENHLTFVFDVNTRGQLAAPDPVGDFARSLFFPLLPSAAQDISSGWLDGDDKNKVKERNAAKFVFELSHTDPVYSGSSVSTIEFDASKGMVAKSKREFSQDFHGKT